MTVLGNYFVANYPPFSMCWTPENNGLGSSICPEQAIMFPDYKTPGIAGAAVGAVSGLKIDLSKLFGGGDALTMAARERDTELVRDGRDAVGMTLGIPKRQEGKVGQPKDDLDRLMDDLDALEI